MHSRPTTDRPATGPLLESPSGLLAELTPHGSLRRLEAFGRSLLLFPATGLEGGPAGVHLRVLDGDRAHHTPLLGPAADAVVVAGEGAAGTRGTWRGLDWSLTLTLAGGAGDDPHGAADPAPAHASWRWSVEVTNTTGSDVVVDLVLTHDPALAHPDAVRTNEYYVAQYLDVTPLETSRGTAVAVRQNMPGETAPWLLLGALGRGSGWATDALQLVERTPGGTRWSGLDTALLPSVRHQHEHTLVTLSDEPVLLPAGATHRSGFVGVVVADHPSATSPDDAEWLATAVRETAVRETTGTDPVGATGGSPVVPTVFSTAPEPACRELTGAELAGLGIAPDGEGATDVELAPDGTPWAWSTPRGHVVLPAKELAVLRPHGQVLRTGDALTPGTDTLTTTVWMAGTFLSQVTRGHVGRDPVLTGRRSYLGLLRAHGARLLVGTGEGWDLLGEPSAWRVGLDGATWWYADDERVLEVEVTAPAHRDVLGLTARVVSGAPARLLLALGTTARGAVADGDAAALLGDAWRLAWDGPAVLGDDAPLHADHVARDAAWVTLATGPTHRLAVTLAATETPAAEPAAADATVSADGEHTASAFWDTVARTLTLAAPAAGEDHEPLVAAVRAALPWFAHDAVVHYLSPRGLEQYSGGAWGTRDVCQGPVGLLTALDRPAEVRDLLARVFRAQNARGDWPQAFEFLPPLPESGQHDAHGDVVHWPLLATGEHLLGCGDGALLRIEVPFVGDDGLTAAAPVTEHLARAVERIEAGAVEGSPLPAYGHGDWNDSLQPADPALARRMVSVWTSVLQTQALRTLAAGLRAVDEAPDLAERAAALADATEDAVHRELLTDDVLPGYVLHHTDGTSEPLVHPRDERTGLTLGILPWVHAVTADLLTAEQAGHHLALVDEHLLGPDGARLFDRPVAYAGGPMSVFQRAEASTFWGREIGLMYVHAHLRWAEALARVGQGARLLRALALATPRGSVDLVPSARPRQSSTYASSSDGAFTDRYDAQERYPALTAGEVPLEGGWRVYSSGPGLFLRLVVEALLGVRRRGAVVELDPVVDPALGELRATVPFDGGTLELAVRPGPVGHGVRRVTVDGDEVDGTALDNPYRDGGLAVPLGALLPAVARPGAGHRAPVVVVETR